MMYNAPIIKCVSLARVRETRAFLKDAWIWSSNPMPELPEVETTVRMLTPPLLGRIITGAWNDWPRHIAAPEFAELQGRISQRRILSISRRGKYIIIKLDSNEFLLIHLKMTGHLSISAESEPLDPHVHTAFTLDNGDQLRFKDVRKFGRVYLVYDPEDILGKLGMEPLSEDFTGDHFRSMLLGRNRMLKPLLLDQSFIAGLGNIYTDEALHDAAIHPSRIATSLTKKESLALHQSITSILKIAINRDGSSVDSYRKPDGTPGDMQNALKVYGLAGSNCPRCGTKIERMILGGRSTHICPSCQK